MRAGQRPGAPGDRRGARRSGWWWSGSTCTCCRPSPTLWRLGEERLVDDDQTIRFGSVRYSTPPGHVGAKVWCRVVGDELVVVGPHQHGPGRDRPAPAVHAGQPTHPRRALPAPSRRQPAPPTKDPAAHAGGGRVPRLGEGAHEWLVEAGAAGAQRVRAKMAQAVELAAVVGADVVDDALGLAAIAGRFGDDDLVSIVDHRAGAGAPVDVVRADETHSVQPGTRRWEGFGR